MTTNYEKIKNKEYQEYLDRFKRGGFIEAGYTPMTQEQWELKQKQNEETPQNCYTCKHNPDNWQERCSRIHNCLGVFGRKNWEARN